MVTRNWTLLTTVINLKSKLFSPIFLLFNCEILNKSIVPTQKKIYVNNVSDHFISKQLNELI